MVHCGSIRQTASIVHMSADCLRTGDKASVHFKFVKHPEFLKVGLQSTINDHKFIMISIKVGQRLVFREGRTKAVGNVTKVIPRPPTTAEAKAAGKATRNEQRNRAMQQKQQQQPQAS